MLLRCYCRCRTWLAQQEGATMVEYAVLAALIVVGLYATVGQLREAINDMFGEIICVVKKGTKTC